MKSEWSVLGVLERNLLLNMADHGYLVAGYDKDVAKVETRRQESKNYRGDEDSVVVDEILFVL